MLLSVLISNWLFACNAIDQNSLAPGIAYIAPVGNPPADTIVWSPKTSNNILVTAGDLGYGRAQVHILDIETGKMKLLAKTNYGDIWGEAWLPDGKEIVLLVSGATKGFSQSGLWILNTETNKMEYIIEKSGAAVVLPDSNTLAILTVDLASTQHPRQISISLADIQTKKTEVIYTNQEATTYLGLSLSSSGRFLVFSLQFDNTDTDNLYILDVQTKNVIQLTSDGGSTFPQWSP